MLKGSKGNVSITYCTFQNNIGAEFIGSDVNGVVGGGAVYLFESSSNVNITNCTFHSNSAAFIGSAVMLIGSQDDVSIRNCTLHNNSAAYGGGGGGGGGGVLFLSSGNVEITNCIYTKNTADNGAAVSITNNINVQAEGEPLGISFY